MITPGKEICRFLRPRIQKPSAMIALGPAKHVLSSFDAFGLKA